MSAEAPNFQSILAGFQSAVSSAGEASRKKSSSLQEAGQQREQFKELREQELERILAEKGLAVCSEYSHLDERGRRRKLGIFPRSEMGLVYQSVVRWRGSHGYEHLVRETTLKLLCPRHLSERPNSAKQSMEMSTEKDGLDIVSIVEERRDGKLVTTVNSIDVSDLSIEKHYRDEVYQYFDLPELPEIPKL